MLFLSLIVVFGFVANVSKSLALEFEVRSMEEEVLQTSTVACKKPAEVGSGLNRARICPDETSIGESCDYDNYKLPAEDDTCTFTNPL